MPADYEALRGMSDGERWVWLAGKLDIIEGRQRIDFSRLNNHEKQIDTIERRCAGRRWQGKLIWAALAAGVGALAERVISRVGGKP